MSAPILLPVVQQRALEALGTYYYLTVPLMKRLGVGSDVKNLRKALSILVNRGLVARSADQPMKPGTGKLPYIYNLTKPGAKVVAGLLKEEPEEVKGREYEGVDELLHLTSIIKTHIALREWAVSAGVSVSWFRGDYEPGTMQWRRATALPYPQPDKPFPGRPIKKNPYYTPDAIAEIQPADGRRRLLVIEVYRGGRRSTLDWFNWKLPELRHVCKERSVEKHHQAESGARFLILFDNAPMLDRALAKWPAPEAPEWSRFFVKHMDELGGDFRAGWRQPGRPSTNLF